MTEEASLVRRPDLQKGMDLPENLVLPLGTGEPYWYWLGGRPALDFANTLRERWKRRVETLVTAADLETWLERADLLPRLPGVEAGDALLEDARDLREAIDVCVVATIESERVPSAAVEVIDRWLPEASTAKRLDRGESGVPALLPRLPADPLRHALGLIALDAAKALGTEQRARLRICASQTCSARFFDHSPGANRRWCSMRACGNLAKVRRHRAERRRSL
jgi:predicted RNA-binding Zn ribbon-like protein